MTAQFTRLQAFRVAVVALVLTLGISLSAQSQCLDGFCPDSIIVEPAGNGTYLLSVQHLCPESQVSWRLNGELIGQSNGNPTLLSFPQFGEVSVQASFNDVDCSLGVSSLSQSITLTGTECPASIIVASNSCERIDFSIAQQNVLIESQWLINGVSYGSGNAITVFPDGPNPEYTVSLAYRTNECTDTLTLIYGANSCNLVCPDSIDARFESCRERDFSVFGLPSDYYVLWSVSDGRNISAQGPLTLAFLEAGVYNINAQFWYPGCSTSSLLSTSVEIEDCSANFCPTEVTVSYPSCQTALLTLNNLPNGAVTTWTYGDNNSEISGSPNTSHTYAAAGTYQVCGSYTGPSCNAPVTLCRSVTVQACGDGLCANTIVVTEGSGNGMNFSIANVPAGLPVFWNFGDNQTQVTGAATSHTYANIGNYVVTATYNDFDCSPTTNVISQSFTVDGDFSGCPNSLSVTALPSPCGSYQFSTNLNNAPGNYSWTFNDGGTSNAARPTYTYVMSGDFTVGLTYTSPTCTFKNLTIPVSVPDCTVPEICPNAIEATSLDNCGSFQFNIGSNAAGQYVVWTFPDAGTYIGSSSENHQFEFAGNYNVCAYYADTQCPNGVNLCVSVQAATCNVSCTLDIVQTSETCGGRATFVATGAPLFSTINWTVDGTSIGTGYSITRDILSGTRNVCASYSISACAATVSDCLNVLIDPCTTVDCPTEITPLTTTTCGTYYLDVSRNAAFESTSWTINGEPVSTENGFNYPFPEEGSYEICANYTSAVCPAGVNICSIFDAPSCNDCPSQLQFLNVSCQSLQVQMGDPTIPAIVTWDFGDGTVYNGGPLDGHEYASSGLYTITGTYSSLFCQGVTLSRTIFIQSCEPECVVFTDVVQSSCGSIQLNASPYPFNAIVNWQLEGFPEIYTGNQVSLNGLNPGNNIICTSIESEFCPEGFEICLNYPQEECNPNACPEFIIVQQSQDECGLFRFQIPDAAIGSTTQWYFPESILGSGSINRLLTTPGSNTISALYTGNDCPAGVTLSVQVDVPYCAFDCAVVPTITETSCGIYNLTANVATENIPVQWQVNGNPLAPLQVNNLQLFQGNYNICVQASSAGCSSTPQSCTALAVDTCIVVNCPTEIVVLPTNECGQFNFSIPGAHPQAVVRWNFPEFVFGTSNQNYTYAFPGFYDVTVTYTAPNCPDGVVLATAVNFLPCTFNCNTNVTITSQSCTGAVFNATSSQSGGFFEWTVDGIVSGVGNTFSPTLSAGAHVICATYQGASCSSGGSDCENVNITPCNINCPTAISVTAVEPCGTYTLTLPGGDPNGFYQWQVNGTNYNGSSVNVFFANPGNYPVSLAYNGNQCSAGTFLTSQIQFTPCPEPCSLSIFNQFQECSTVVLNAVAPADQIINWTLNGEPFTTGYLFNTELEPGNYEVCASFSDANCPNGPDFLACIDVVVVPCLDCSLDIVATSLNPALPSNPAYMFEANGDPGVGTVTWDFGDNTTQVDDSLVIHTFNAEGTYAVCASVIDEACGTRSACEQITIDQCTNYSSLNITNVNIGGYGFFLFNSSNQVLISDEFNFVAPNQVNSYNLCLADGCYRLRFTANEEINPNDLPQIVRFEDSDVTGYFDFINNNTYEFIFGVNSDCGNLENCTASFSSVFTENAGELVFSNTSSLTGTVTDIAYSWTFGDGSEGSTEVSPSHVFAQNGSYQACLQMSTVLGCTDTDCQTIEVYSNTENCQDTLVAFAWSTDVINEPFDSLTIRLYRNTGNELLGTFGVLSNDAPNTLSLCLPGDCYYYTVQSAAINAGTQTIIAYVNGQEHSQVTLTSGNLEGEAFIGLIAGCPNGIDNAAQVMMQLYPNPTRDAFVIEGEWNGASVMRIYDATGRMIDQQNLTSRKTVIQATDLPAGLYLVQVSTSQGIATRALQIVR